MKPSDRVIDLATTVAGGIVIAILADCLHLTGLKYWGFVIAANFWQIGIRRTP